MLHSLPVNRIAGTAPGRRNKRFLALLLTLTAILALMLPASRVQGNSPSAAQFPPDYNGNGCIDIGDIQISRTGEVVRFTYHTDGVGPHEWEYKYDENRLNEQAANAILKVLEDAPVRLLLLLLAPSARSVLATIRSRSIEIPLKGVPRERIREFLAARGVDEAGAGRLADYAAGAPGRAIRLSGNQDLLQILAEVRGWTDALLAADMRAALRLASELSSLAGRARKHLPGEDGASERQALAWVLDAVMAEWQSRLARPLPAGWTASALARAVDAVNRARWLIMAYAQADLQLEQMVISVIARRNSPSASNATRQPRSASN